MRGRGEKELSGYHYTECGLDNVWLLNGYEVQDFGSYGQGVSVRQERALWAAIAASTVLQDAPLTGQAFRFLRGLMDLTQTAVGRRLGHRDHQTVLRWERHRRTPVPAAADVLMRSWYLESVGHTPMVTRMSESLAETADAPAEHPAPDLVLRASESGGWVKQVEMPAMAEA